MAAGDTPEGENVFEDGHVAAELHDLYQLGGLNLSLAGALDVPSLEGLVHSYESLGEGTGTAGDYSVTAAGQTGQEQVVGAGHHGEIASSDLDVLVDAAHVGEAVLHAHHVLAGGGDTFTGYFVACLAAGTSPRECLDLATRASALAVSRPGAAPSIPTMEEVRSAQLTLRED